MVPRTGRSKLRPPSTLLVPAMPAQLVRGRALRIVGKNLVELFRGDRVTPLLHLGERPELGLQLVEPETEREPRG